MKTKKPESKKENVFDYEKRQKTVAQHLADRVQEKLKHKKLVPHPTMPKTYIYV